MKKVLTLMLVLSMVSMASAAIINTATITVNGNPWEGEDVYPSDIILIEMVHNGVGQFGGYSGPAELLVTNADLVGFTPAAAGYIANTFAASEVGNDVIVAGSTTGMPHPADMFTLEIHVDGLPSDMIIIDWIYGAEPTGLLAAPGPEDTWEYVEMHIAPEPATMAILGLGGLLLRRKK